MIKIHCCSFVIANSDAAKNKSGFTDSPIKIWRLQSISLLFFEDLKLFDMQGSICEAMLVAMHAGVTSLKKFN